jgi:hypothetical protein
VYKEKWGMLGIHDALVFPRIVLVERDLLEERGVNKIYETRLYRVDWDKFDLILAKKVDRVHSLNKIAGIQTPYIQVLPEDYEQKIRDARFIINEPTLKEINRNCYMAALEADRIDFNKYVIDDYYRIVYAYIRVVFKQISDCLYDPDSNYYSRDRVRKSILRYSMLYKFWGHQIGFAMLWKFSGLKELDDQLNSESVNHNLEEAEKRKLDREKAHLCAFIRDMHEYFVSVLKKSSVEVK